MTVNVSKPALNVREKLAELDKPTGIAGEAMLRAETPQEQFNLIGAGRRNWIINGDFQVSQRGDYTTAAVNVSNNTYYVDRFKQYIFNVSATTQRTNNYPPNANYGNSLKMTATSASATGYIDILQYVEFHPAFVGKEMTVSCWMRSNNPEAQIRVTVGGQRATKNHSGNGQWEYLTATFTYPTGSTFNIGLEFITYDNGQVNVASGDYIEIAQVQLELGKVATPFEHRSYGEELALCQRYYWQLGGEGVGQFFGIGQAYSTTQFNGVTVPFPVTMRDAPAMSYASVSNFRVQNSAGSGITTTSLSISSGEASVSTANIRGAVSSGLVAGNSTLLYAANTSAILKFDAEL